MVLIDKTCKTTPNYCFFSALELFWNRVQPSDQQKVNLVSILTNTANGVETIEKWGNGKLG